MAEELKEIFFAYITPAAREVFYSSRFTVGVNIMGKNFLSNNADINVEFVMDSDQDNPHTYAFSNTNNKMVFLCRNFIKKTGRSRMILLVLPSTKIYANSCHKRTSPENTGRVQ